MADDDLNLSAYWNCRYGRGHTKVTRLDQRYDANIFEWNDKLLLWEHTKFHQIDEFRMQKKKSFVNNWENSVGGVKVWNIICTNWKTTKYFSLHLIFVVSPVGQKWDQRAMYLIPFYLWYLVCCVVLWLVMLSNFRIWNNSDADLQSKCNQTLHTRFILCRCRSCMQLKTVAFPVIMTGEAIWLPCHIINIIISIRWLFICAFNFWKLF